MRERLIDGLVRGDRATWAAYGALWVLTAILVLLHRPATDRDRAGRGRAALAWALVAVTTATSLAGLPLAAALAVPRIRWQAVEAADLIATTGDSWRKLRGPAVVIPGPEPELAVPTIDAAHRWILVGLLSGAPVPGLPPAEATAAAPGSARLCRSDSTECRAWPVAWPDPARPAALGELIWARASRGTVLRALAYDVETGLYLSRIEAASGAGDLAGPHLEVVGRPSADPKVEGPSVVLVVRRVAAGRLRAARVAALPDAARPGGHVFQLHRAHASLTAAPRVYAWIARPLLSITSLALPLAVGLYLAARRRGDGARVLLQLEAAAAFAAGVAAAAPAVVALVSLWTSR